MNIDLEKSVEQIRSHKYSEQELDEILDLISHAFNLRFRIEEPNDNTRMYFGIKKIMKVSWADDCNQDDSDFLNNLVKTNEFQDGIKNVFGASDQRVKELMITALYGNTLYRAGFDFNELITDEFIPICDVPTFDSISELKMKLAITNG